MQGTRLTFRSREDAMHFAEKQGTFFFFFCLVRVDWLELNRPLFSRLGLLCVSLCQPPK
jgi:hypothetical protein